MKWGDTQNLLSLIAGLNLAYYAFKEIRAPHLEGLARDTEKLTKDLGERLDDLGKISDWELLTRKRSPMPHHKLQKALLPLWLRAMDLNGEVTKLVRVTNSRAFDTRFGLPAMLIGIAATVALIISTVLYEQTLPLWLFWTIVVTGFAPVVFIIILNYLVVFSAFSKFGKEYHELFMAYFSDIVGDWDFVHVADVKHGQHEPWKESEEEKKSRETVEAIVKEHALEASTVSEPAAPTNTQS